MLGDLGNSLSSCTQPDGYVENFDDCDDTDAQVATYIVEIAQDGIDQNCDGQSVRDGSPSRSQVRFGLQEAHASAGASAN